MTKIRISKNHQGWQAVFLASPDMPLNVALPLPFTTAATAETVRADLFSRFHGDVAIITAANSR